MYIYTYMDPIYAGLAKAESAKRVTRLARVAHNRLKKHGCLIVTGIRFSKTR